MAVPYLKELGADVLRVVVARHPDLTVDSFLRLGFFHEASGKASELFRRASSRVPMVRDRYPLIRGNYHRFLEAHGAPAIVSADPSVSAYSHWLTWMERALPHAQQTWRLDEIGVTEIGGLLSWLGITVEPDRIRSALTDTSLERNRKPAQAETPTERSAEAEALRRQCLDVWSAL